jgi:hypothetical protein
LHLVSALLLVLWANILRITIATAVLSRTGVDLFNGSVHVLFGWSIFILALALVYCVDQVLSRWLDRHRRHRGRAPAAGTSSRSSPSSATSVPGPIPVWLGIAVALSLAFAGVGVWTHLQLRGAWAPPRLPPGATFDLPARLGDWERVDVARPAATNLGELEGKHSSMWTYHRGRLTAVVALDYPFLGYHDNTVCYRTTGWTLLQRTQQSVPDGPFELVRMEKPPFLQGVLRFSLCDESGRWITAADSVFAGGSTGPRGWVAQTRRVSESLYAYQVQVLSESYTGWTAEQEAQLGELYDAVRAQVRGQLLKQLGNATPQLAPGEAQR